MSKKKRKYRELQGFVLVDPGLKIAEASRIRHSNEHLEKKGGSPSAQLQFEERGNCYDPELADRKKMIALLMRKRDMDARPECPHCPPQKRTRKRKLEDGSEIEEIVYEKRKVQRVGEGLDAPFDTCCGVCSKTILERGWGPLRDPIPKAFNR